MLHQPSDAAAPASEVNAGQAGLILFAGCLAVVVTTIACWLLGIRDGLRAEQAAQVASLFPRLSLRDFRPEPLERAQCLAFFAGTYLAAVLTAVRPPSRRTLAVGRIAFRIGFVAAVIAVLGFGQSSFGHAMLKNPIFLELLPPGDRIVQWIVFVAAFLVPFALPAGTTRNALVNLLALALMALTVYVCLDTTMLEPVRAVGYDRLNHHEAAVLHAVVQSAAGQIPYRDFTPQYGGYGLFIRPFLALGTDPWGQLTLFLTVAKLLTFGFLIGSIYLPSRSLLAAALGGVIYLWLLQPQLSDPIFQQFPIRTLFPAAFLFAFAASRGSDSAAAIMTGSLGPIAIFW